MNINLLDTFEKTVNKHPDKIAVVHSDSEISFAELRRRARILGAEIFNRVKGQTDRPIGVFLPKCIDAVTADLAVMYSGNPFMNLDTKLPKERINNIFEKVIPAMVITDSKCCDKLPDMNAPVIVLDNINFDNQTAIQNASTVHSDAFIDTDPFCIINTSGSTGTPKSAVLNHRGFFDYLAATNSFSKFDGSEIIGSLSPIMFDHFVYEFSMLLNYGSTLVLLEAAHSAFPAKLLETLSKRHVNYIFWVPSIMVTIANMDLLSKIKLPDLKLIWFAGEVFPIKQFLYWYDKLPDVKFVNLYGPVEITLDCTAYQIYERPNENEPLPIGKPLKNVDVLLLNEYDKLCQTGEEGEICVRGSSLAMGYYNNPEKTAAAFVQNPLNKSYPEIIYRTGDIGYMREDGNIIFKGRKDSLIKHMGYRIELGEVEHVITNDLKLVEYCCAVYRQHSKEIILYYESDKEISVKDFRAALSKVFPPYMIPSVYQKLDALPRNTNGKIDRLALKNKANNYD